MKAIDKFFINERTHALKSKQKSNLCSQTRINLV